MLNFYPGFSLETLVSIWSERFQLLVTRNVYLVLYFPDELGRVRLYKLRESLDKLRAGLWGFLRFIKFFAHVFCCLWRSGVIPFMIYNFPKIIGFSSLRTLRLLNCLRITASVDLYSSNVRCYLFINFIKNKSNTRDTKANKEYVINSQVTKKGSVFLSWSSFVFMVQIADLQPYIVNCL